MIHHRPEEDGFGNDLESVGRATPARKGDQLRRNIALLWIALSFFLSYPAFGLDTVVMSVNGTSREAAVYVPENAGEDALPIVFAFHGHGGSKESAAARFHIETIWPEAIVVYPQGLPTVSKLVDPGGKKSGWQGGVDEQSGRDLSFFDTLLEYLEETYKVDHSRIYAMGFSNGAVFTYVLWAARGKILAAVSPIAGLLGSKSDREMISPKPVFHVAGRKDPLVKFKWQVEMINFLVDVNGCGAPKPIDKSITEYPSRLGTDVFTYIDDSGHEIPEDALPSIVDFFKRQRLP